VQCVARPGVTTVAFDGVEISWFEEHDDSTDPASGRDLAVLDGPGVRVTVEERTVSGGDWLEERWRQGGEIGKVLIGLIEAADGFTREDFRDYWWDQHRPLANSLVPEALGPVAYVHDYVLDTNVVVQGFNWAGIGEMYEQSLATARERGEWFESDAARPLALDEERFMVRATRQVLVTDASVLIHRPAD
jgi:hypothetical protein